MAGSKPAIPVCCIPHQSASTPRARNGAQEIVTFNLRDFPQVALHPYGIRAAHPDVFVEHLLDLNPAAFPTVHRPVQ
jgi:hypothetical protein